MVQFENAVLRWTNRTSFFRQRWPAITLGRSRKCHNGRRLWVGTWAFRIVACYARGVLQKWEKDRPLLSSLTSQAEMEAEILNRGRSHRLSRPARRFRKCGSHLCRSML